MPEKEVFSGFDTHRLQPVPTTRSTSHQADREGRVQAHELKDSRMV
jgi:hypothetical protein